jgi:hypothetical protein
MLSRHSRIAAATRPGGNRLRMIVTPNSFRKKTPHPTRERRAGQRTDLVSPTASETTKTEVVPNG